MWGTRESCGRLIWSTAVLITFIFWAQGVCAQNSTSGSGNNAVCTQAGWKSVPFFGAAVSSSDFTPMDVSVNSPYYRGPVERRVIPTGILVALALLLLIVFVLWRVLRWCCICCCRCCCVTPAPYPEEILGTCRQFILKIVVVVLSLGVCACCAYGMSQIDPQLVNKGMGAINSLKDYMQTVYDTADGIVNGVDGVNGLLDQVQTILDVDVNITDISNGVMCVAPFVTDLQPSTALDYLQDVQHQISTVITPDISGLGSNFNDLGTETTAFNTDAAVIATVPPLLSSYATQTTNLINDVSTLQTNWPSGTNPGPGDSYVAAVGADLTAFALPLDNGNTRGKTGQLYSFSTVFTDLFSHKTADLATLTSIQNDLNAMTAAGADLTATLPLLSAYLTTASSNYTDTRPCINALIARLLHINTTVIILPSTLSTATTELQSVQSTLDAVLLNGSPNATSLAALINAAIPSISTTPFSATTLNSLTAAQTQLGSLSDPDASGGVNQYLSALKSASSSATGASSQMDACNNAYSAYQSTNTIPNYNTFLSDCQTASTAMQSDVEPLLSGSAYIGASSAATSISNLQSALAALPSSSAITSQLNAVSTSLQTVPSLTTYISALTPAVTAYNALGPNILSDVQSQIATINNTITSSIATARNEVSSNLGPVQTDINNLHNQTVDRITGYQNQYQPTVAHYDKIRQAVEYVYYALAMAVCLILVIAVLTNCPFLAGFFTLVLILLTLVYSIIAVILFLIASIGNDGCSNMESYIISEIPSIAGNDVSLQSKATALADYYLYNQGGPVSNIVQNVAGVNLTDVFAQVNTTRDQAIASIEGGYTLQPKMQAIVSGFEDLSDTAVANITAAESLASYDNIHPLYIQVKTFACCSGVNMLGNLWAAMFSACCLSIILLLFMFVYIKDLDRLPARGCCGCAPRSAAEFDSTKRPTRRELEEAERLGSGVPSGTFSQGEATARSALSVHGTAGSRGSLLAPHSPKHGGSKHAGSAYPVHASIPKQPPAQVQQRQEYMRHALQMDSASY